MGKKRKAKKTPQQPIASSVEDDEIPEGFEVLDTSDFTKRLGVPSKQTKNKRKKRSPFAVLDAQPWEKLDASDLQFDDSSGQMLSLEALDGSYYDNIFVREAPAAKKQKVSHYDDDTSDQEEESDGNDSFKETPLFLAPKLLKQKHNEKKEKKSTERFKYLQAPPSNDVDELEIQDEEEDYELEDDDVFDIEVQGVVQDDDYSDEPEDVEETKAEKPVQESDIGDWCGADQRITQALNEKLSITSPTTCQQLVLPVALSARQDILLAAPTVSNESHHSIF